jgi:hypothetical protein
VEGRGDDNDNKNKIFYKKKLKKKKESKKKRSIYLLPISSSKYTQILIKLTLYIYKHARI